MRGETRKTSENRKKCNYLDTLKDFFAKFEQVVARISSAGAGDIFEADSNSLLGRATFFG
jgi:hypothetical protein